MDRFLTSYSPYSVYQKYYKDRIIEEKHKKKIESILNEENKGYIYLTKNKICYFPLTQKEEEIFEPKKKEKEKERIIQFNISEIISIVRVGPQNVFFKLDSKSSYLFCFVANIKKFVEVKKKFLFTFFFY